MVLTKKFRSTSGKIERVVSEGKVALVGTDWKTLPSPMWSAAYASHCESEDMVANKIGGMSDDPEVKVINKALDKKARIKDAIFRLLEDNNVEDFTYYRKTKDYRPATKAINKLVGFQVSNAERDMIWHRLLESGTSLPEFN